MATQASTDPRRAVSPRPSAPRVTYDVGSKCFATTLSIVGLVAVFVVLAII
ncbi:hypothetical protein AAFP35_04770 [Gordonia sp. CPCC 206044]|uniref:hypothetical protein n=1 Tax=Gordonia sp. CPCC 206044 TaxID=3140793 RepID=UPI003AF341EC